MQCGQTKKCERNKNIEGFKYWWSLAMSHGCEFGFEDYIDNNHNIYNNIN